MSDLFHLQLQNSASSLPYTYPGDVRSPPFRLPLRDRAPHAQQLATSLQEAEAEVATLRQQQPPVGDEIDGIPITVRSDPEYDLPLKSLERRRDGIELLSVKKVDGVMTATLFVRRDKIVNLLRIIDQYEREDSTRTKDGATKTVPKNQKLVESIASIRLLAVQDLWQDEPGLYPTPDQAIWWETWARRGSDWWQGTATELAASGHVAVYPVTGWWRERPHLRKLENKARYTLVISIETPDQEIDLYHAIENLATVTTEFDR